MVILKAKFSFWVYFLRPHFSLPALLVLNVIRAVSFPRCFIYRFPACVFMPSLHHVAVLPCLLAHLREYHSVAACAPQLWFSLTAYPAHLLLDISLWLLTVQLQPIKSQNISRRQIFYKTVSPAEETSREVKDWQ